MQVDERELSRATAARLDADDPLASIVDEFSLPAGKIYLNGNSLGPMPSAAAVRAVEVVQQEWAEDLVTSWNKAGWFRLPHRLGGRLAPLIGAGAGEVVLTDNTSINQFRAVYAALSLRPERRVIVMEGSNFPTNNYVVQGLVEMLGRGHEIRFAEKDGILDAIDDTVAVVALTHVHYKTAHVLDMASITRAAHAAGATTVWDLCHSVGAIPVDLNGCEADFAIGCTYKYLNGGPGSPAFVFAARRHHSRVSQPITGWWGHSEPFAFDRDYSPAEGIGRFLTGTQGIASMMIAEPGLGLALQAGANRARAKSIALSELFRQLVSVRLPAGALVLDSPADPAQRGGHLAYRNPNGYAIMKALIAHGVVGDFRAPDVIRFGFSPLYLRFADIWEAVDRIATIVAKEMWRDPVYSERDLVT